MAYTYNLSYAANAWAITQAMTLSVGPTYTISFWYEAPYGTSSTEKLNSGKKNAAAKNLEFNATAKFLASEIQEAEVKCGSLMTFNDEIDEVCQEVTVLEDAYNSSLTSINLLKALTTNHSRCGILRGIVKSPIPKTDEMIEILNTGRRLTQYSRRKSNFAIIQSTVTHLVPDSSELERLFKSILKLSRLQVLSQKIGVLKKFPTILIEHDLAPQRLLINQLNSFTLLRKTVAELELKLNDSNKQVAEVTKKRFELQGQSIQCPNCGHFFIGESHGHE